MVLQRTGDNFARRSRAVIDQHDEGYVGRNRLQRGRVAWAWVFEAALCRDDIATIDEGIDHADRRLENTAGVIAKVED